MKKICWIVMFCTVLYGCDLLTELILGDDQEDDSKVTGVEAILGCGYDLFDEFADPEYVKEPILDYTKLSEAGAISKVILDKSEFTSTSGSTHSEYSESLATKACVSGNYGYFSGSLKTSFETSRFSSSDYEFATVHADIKKTAYIVKDRNNLEYVKSFLSENFITALNDPNTTAHDIFYRFGTHLMTGVILGARMDYNLSAQKTSSSGSQSISALAKARFKSAFKSYSASLEVNSNVSWSDYFSQEDVRTNVVGGASQYGMNIHTDSDYSAWIDSIESKGVFSNFYTDSLVPLWSLAATQERSEQIQAGFTTWAEERKLKLTGKNPELAIVDIRIENSDEGKEYDHKGRTYHRIDMDLNRDSGGKDIYIYTTLGMDDGSDGLMPITYIGFVYDDDEDDALDDLPKKGTMINQDLNEKAGGDFIFLVYSRNSSNPPIRSLYVLNKGLDDRRDYSYYPDGKKDFQYFDCYRYVDGKIDEDTPANLNQRAGGNSIFLYRGYDK